MLADPGAGCRNVEVGALPVLRGVKCCCSVLNAGLAGAFFGSSLTSSFGFGGEATALEVGGATVSPFVPALGRSPLLDTSVFVLKLAVRLKPARRADDLATAGAGFIELLVVDVAVLEGMWTDFGLSVVGLGLVVLLLPSGTVLVD